MPDGKKREKARLVAKGCQDSDLGEGAADSFGCVGHQPSHLLAIPLGAIKKWEIGSLDIKNAF